MSVYLLFEIIPITEFTNHYGEVAPDMERVIGVYDTKTFAEDVKEIYERKVKEDVEELECDPVYFEVREFMIEPWKES